MRYAVAAAILLFCAPPAGRGATTRPASRPAPAVSEADRLAADSLCRDAVHPGLLAEAPARVARRRAALEFAARLAPDQPETWHLLADACRAGRDFAREADALDRCLALDPADHATGLRWLLLRQETLHTAEDRIAFLKSVLARPNVTPALQAEALIAMAPRLLGQGHRDRADDALDQALRLVPGHPAALHLRAEFAQPPAPGAELAWMLADVADNPGDVPVLRGIGDRLHALGLHDEAILMFQAAWRASRAAAAPSALAAEGLADAMLDAGQADKAVAVLTAAMETFPAADGLKFKLVEAHRLANTGQAEEFLSRIAPDEAPPATRPAASSDVAGRLAWFYLNVKPDAKLALKYARQAQSGAIAATPAELHDLAVLLGAARLASGEPAEGVRLLRPLAEEDIFAAAYLARQDYAAGDAEAGRKSLLAGLALGRGGWAFRRLRDLAAAHKVALPPMPGAEAARALLRRFDPRCLEPAQAPQRFIAVTLTGPAAPPAPGEPLVVAATLTNIGEVPIRLGPRGLLRPTLALRATVEGHTPPVTDLPVARWPAPRELAPGAPVATRVRLDVGSLRRLLVQRPLDEFRITVEGLLAPAAEGEALISELPAVPVRPVRITRASLLARAATGQADLPRAYAESLGRIARDLRQGDLPARCRAARQVASLLAFARDIERRRIAPPPPLAGQIDRNVLLRLLIEALKDRSPAVRAEAVAALRDVDLDDDILKCLAPAITDASPLVRFRAAELIGASDSPGKEMVLRHLCRDGEHDLVRAMAGAFLPAPPRPEGR